MKEERNENSRDKLIEIMSNYQGYKNIIVVIVFDARKVLESFNKIHAKLKEKQQLKYSIIGSNLHRMFTKY